jgi:hypothetical protein
MLRWVGKKFQRQVFSKREREGGEGNEKHGKLFLYNAAAAAAVLCVCVRERNAALLRKKRETERAKEEMRKSNKNSLPVILREKKQFSV